MRDLSDLADAVLAAPRAHRRRLVALAGPPGSGKSTLAARLAEALVDRGCAARVVPMDGFHLDNALLEHAGLLPRKGAPETFDVGGFSRLMPALANEEVVYYPLFDRSRDLAIAGAGQLDPACDTVIVEGNYLLLDEAPWRGLSTHWDLSVGLEVAWEVLRARLLQRWRDAGLDETAAQMRAEGNDLPNANRVQKAMLPVDVFFANEGSQS
ncbi:nucleoside/nucleotide kinase family protein [uncultured Roseobacter sp.]|uniref:nucleoside/nucleotide kinase family protein n=1 Tax=uncultured Roseobacter sp. TaxID=114847 RepID=UPI0026220E72|nr:nucleoside/nucleotide kinase family protein [uncultured Roseobacter sp.]